MAIPSITRTLIHPIALGVSGSVLQADESATETAESGLSLILSPLALSAVGERGRVGGLSRALAALALDASGISAFHGALAETLDALTLSAAGSGPPGRTGALAATLDALTVSASHGSNELRGALAQTLDALVLSAAGGPPGRTGALAQTLAALAVSASHGSNELRGALARTLDALALSAAGGPPGRTGALAQTLAALTVSASHGSNELRGALAQTLDALVLSAAGVGPGAAWTPASLTALGAWYDPSDFSTMWQDSAQTTPVTAAGQSVGYISDKSANAFHLSQATSGLRPVLRQDGNSKWYLEFASANRSRLDPVAGNLGTFHQGVGLFFIAAATQAVTDGAGGALSWLGSPTVEFGHSVEGLRTGWTALGRRLNSDGWQAIAVGTNDYTLQSVIGVYDYSSATASIYKSNSSVASGSFQTSGLSDTTGAATSFGIGDSAGYNFAFDGKLYQFVMGTALSSGERASLDTFLQATF